MHVKRTRGRTNEMCLEMVHVRRIKGKRGGEDKCLWWRECEKDEGEGKWRGGEDK